MQSIKTCLRLRSSYFGRRLRHCACLNYVVAPKILDCSTLVKNPSVGVFRLSSKTSVSEDLLDLVTFEKACDETLESLTEYFEQIVEDTDNLKYADISYSSGVLTVNLGSQYGTYVINRQSPNRQIWLSSPVSGPKRYDFIAGENCWVYKHDGQSLHELLQREISKIVRDVNFTNCSYARVNK